MWHGCVYGQFVVGSIVFQDVLWVVFLGCPCWQLPMLSSYLFTIQCMYGRFSGLHNFQWCARCIISCVQSHISTIPIIILCLWLNAFLPLQSASLVWWKHHKKIETTSSNPPPASNHRWQWCSIGIRGRPRELTCTSIPPLRCGRGLHRGVFVADLLKDMNSQPRRASMGFFCGNWGLLIQGSMAVKAFMRLVSWTMFQRFVEYSLFKSLQASYFPAGPAMKDQCLVFTRSWCFASWGFLFGR